MTPTKHPKASLIEVFYMKGNHLVIETSYLPLLLSLTHVGLRRGETVN